MSRSKNGTQASLSDVLAHPIVIVMFALLIAWKGYRFGQWLRADGGVQERAVEKEEGKAKAGAAISWPGARRA